MLSYNKRHIYASITLQCDCNSTASRAVVAAQPAGIGLRSTETNGCIFALNERNRKCDPVVNVRRSALLLVTQLNELIPEIADARASQDFRGSIIQDDGQPKPNGAENELMTVTIAATH